MPLNYGATVIPEPKFGKESFLEDLMKYKPTHTIISNSFWLYVLENGDSKKIDMSRMKYPISGGEKILPLDEKRMNTFLKEHGCKHIFFKGYGMCELGSTVSGMTDAPNYHTKFGGSGHPLLNAVVSAFDIKTDEELRYGEHGEIRVCSPAHMKGYYKNPEATEAFFKTDKNGVTWGCTGDIGYVDEDGEVFILGRADDCFQNNNGEIVYLFDIEDEIYKEDTIDQCKVVNIEENDETKLVAHIVFRTGTNNKEQILKHINDKLQSSLPAELRPDYYKIHDIMPVNNNGKRDILALKKDRTNLLSF